ncbi:MAG: EAL domain-containing protein [Methylophilaceae bacterium]|nr:EAL domain-containing protein [Methyloradius sp.]
MKPSDKLLVERVLASLNRVAVVFADEALNLHYINPYGFELFDLVVPDNHSPEQSIFSADTPVKLPDAVIERISHEINQQQHDFIAEFNLGKQGSAEQQKILQFYIAPLPSLLGISSFSDNFKKNKATQKPGYLFQVYDITESEATGKRLQQAKIAFESAAEGIMIMDDKTRIIAMNKGFTDITGFSENEMMGEIPNVFHGEKYDAVFYQSLWHNLKYEGYWRGELWNTRKNGEQYSEWLTLTTVKDRQNNVVNYVGVFADISELKHSQNRLNELVNHDSLTGLPNRTLLNELLSHAIKRAEREQNQLAVLFIDLDRFKAINDSLGHQVGDKLLYEVANRIKLAVRDSDVVARLGGDEFLVMMDMIKHKQDVELVTKKIIKSLQAEFVIDGRDLFIGASVGIALYPEHSMEVDGLVNAADIAMYHVKNSGKNSHCFYSADLSKNANELFMMENHLRRALERDQLEVYYQPQVRIRDGKIIGAESLLRWQHPELGMVSPAKFIPLAEETGLILQIGEWVLRESALQASRWAHAGYHLNRVSVNVSGVQIQRSNFADTVYGVLIETDCNPRLLELEITESTVMHNTEFVISVFNRIKNLGLKLAIDDFGTGYSSLSHLKRLPLDKLKIDQSFVRELPGNADDAAIANAIHAMANSLGFNVIAEGVETEAQAAFLLEMGCEIAQGYLYSRPVTAIQFTALLEAERLKDKTNQDE